MESEQSVNSTLAEMNLIVRRMQRAKKVYSRGVKSGQKDSTDNNICMA